MHALTDSKEVIKMAENRIVIGNNAIGNRADPFDPKCLRMPQDFRDGVDQITAVIPLRKPLTCDVIRIHPNKGKNDG